jgi:hypothetical protein
MGFTQRQAAGKFTRDEVTMFIGQLRESEFEGNRTIAPRRSVGPSATAQALLRVPAEELAAELRRRGWTVSEA